MSALERLERMPYWPVHTTAPVATAYMCVSVTTFMARSGEHGVKEGANVFWARARLDQLVAAQFGLSGVTPAPDQPMMGLVRPVPDASYWE